MPIQFPKEDLIYSPETETFLKSLLNADSQPEIKKFSDCLYLNFYSNGISCCFDKKENDYYLAALHFYNQPINGFKSITDQLELPYGLTKESTLKSIVQKFAPIEPEKGGGQHLVNIWIRYPQQKLMLEFPTRNWNDGDITWLELILYK